MTTLRRIVIAGLVTGALLTGCGGGGTAPASTSAPAVTTPATDATTPATNNSDAYPAGYPAPTGTTAP